MLLLFETYSVVTFFRTPHNHFLTFLRFHPSYKGKYDKNDKKMSLEYSCHRVFSASLVQHEKWWETDPYARRSRIPAVSRSNKIIRNMRRQNASLFS